MHRTAAGERIALADALPRTAATRRGRSVLEWAYCSAAVGIAVALVDAGLLQRKRGLFTGGFLAPEQLTTAGERGLFMLLSVVSDGALAGVLVAAAYSVARALGARLAAARALAIGCATAPFLVADVFSYELHRYLGDAFDFGLMFDLTGRNTSEILAVSSGHLVAPVAAVLAAAAGLAILTLLAHRFSRGASTAVRVPWVLPLVVALAGGSAHVSARLQSPALDEGLRRKPSGKVYGALAAALTDFDRDGYGMLSRPADGAPFDGRVHPYAVDWPGNGLDENGVGGDLPAAVKHLEPQVPPRWQSRPPVVLIVLESFRADVLGMRVNGRPVTPVLDALAASGISSSRAYSHNGYTAQSRFHLLTGSLAGLRGGTSIIDDFKRNGYEVGYFSAQDDSFGGPEFSAGMERADVRFDARSAPDLRYSTFSTAGSLAVPANVVEERIAAFLEARERSRPLFLYVNLHDTHFPYHHTGIEPLVSSVVLAPAEIRPDRARELREMYANTAANVDRAIGRILERVRVHLGDAPGVLVTADHGESLFDEGFLGHGYALNEAQTRVPLVVANLPVVIQEPFGQADLRDSINTALASNAPGEMTPVLEARTGAGVFQYLGLLDRPRAIAEVQRHGRSVVDLRVSQGDVADAAALRVVHTWESMVVARQGHNGRPER